MSHFKHACYSTVLVTLIGLASYSHVLILFNIEQRQSTPVCYAHTGIYQILYDFIYFATYSFIPPILMMIVGLGTFRNIHQTRRRIESVGTVNGTFHHLRKRDRQLIKMLLVQLICTVILTLPIAIQKLYTTLTQNMIKDSYQIAEENFISQLLRILTHINASISFYL